MKTQPVCEREFDFSLVLDGTCELTEEVENNLFEAGCDDATIGVRYGRIFMQFSRTAASLKDAILSAIHDVRQARLAVLQVDECNLVTQAEIARRIKRTRQAVHQYITGQRGPGGFPPPVCQLHDDNPLWQWCAVSFWLNEHDMIKPGELDEAEFVFTINLALESARQRGRNIELFEEVMKAVDY